jgi:uncharacterized protein
MSATDAASRSRSVRTAALEDVVLADPYLVNAHRMMVDYLLRLEPDRFLHGFATNAGLTPAAESPYGGWERTSGTRFQGHFFGHYVSALSQAYAGATQEAQKARLLARLTTAVNGLKSAQAAYAMKDPANAGYLSPFPVELLPHGGDGLLVPFYNLHKVLAGLLAASHLASEPVAATALEVASQFGTWLATWGRQQVDPAALLSTEYGGMNEALYELFGITKDPDHKRAAEYFDEVPLFEQLAAGTDVLNGKHANTTIPKLVGALKRYTVLTDDPDLHAMLTQAEKDSLGRYRAAAERFWQMVVDDHTYANGGNSRGEHFHAVGTLHEQATNGETTGYGENSTVEGCNEYNMLKLSRALFQVDPDVKYADYYERAFINSILASQNPETGMMTYFQPQAAGYAKVFGREFDEFWCDHGTATESFTKLGDSIFFIDGRSIYVNMFRSAVLSSAEHNLRVEQRSDVPNVDTVTISVSALDGGTVSEATTLRLRVPSWVAGTPTLVVNGQPRDIATVREDGYLAFPVAAGDEISYSLPAKVAVDDRTENPNWVAFTYGPVVLATELSRKNVNSTYTAGVLVRLSVADKTLGNNVRVDDSTSWKRDIEANLVRIGNGENGNGVETMRFSLKNVDAASADLVFEPYYSLYDARYAIYMTLVEPDSPAAQAQILKLKQQLRSAETTVDSLSSFDDNNSEAEKNVVFSKSSVGVWQGEGYRDGQIAADAFFQYDMTVDPTAAKTYLGVRYFGGDDGRTFDVYVNDVLLKHEWISSAPGATTWYVQHDEIPHSVLDDIPAMDSYKRDQNGQYALDARGHKVPVVTVRFQGNGRSRMGGVYGVSITGSIAYGTDAELSALSASNGVLSPGPADGVHEYRLTVPSDAASVSIEASPSVPSGLVYFAGVLVDDATPRTVALEEGEAPTVVDITAYAQDHTTSVTYRIAIMRESRRHPCTLSKGEPNLGELF